MNRCRSRLRSGAAQDCGTRPPWTSLRTDLALDALERLAPDQARVLRYSLQEHLTVKQMSERLERSENAVKKLHGRAIVSFRKELEHLRDETRG